MTRLIDADALIEKLEKELEVEPSKSIQTSLIKSVCLLFCKTIELQPTVDLRKVAQDYVSDTTVDAVPVIRCKDCIHNVANRKTDPMDITDYSGQDIVCDYFMTDGQEPDDYCSKAERKEE